jgi:hypothetical protein
MANPIEKNGQIVELHADLSATMQLIDALRDSNDHDECELGLLQDALDKLRVIPDTSFCLWDNACFICPTDLVDYLNEQHPHFVLIQTVIERSSEIYLSLLFTDLGIPEDIGISIYQELKRATLAGIADRIKKTANRKQWRDRFLETLYSHRRSIQSMMREIGQSANSI